MEAIKRRVLVILGVLFFSIQSFSQRNDTIPNEVKESQSRSRRAAAVAAEKFAITRPLNIEFTYSSPYNFTPEKDNNSLPESKMKRFSQARISTNINFIKKKNWLLGTTLGYRYTSIEADMAGTSLGKSVSVEKDFHYFHAGANFAYFSTLFNKRTVYTSSIIVDANEKFFGRVNALFTGTMMLKANERTRMSVGILVTTDPLSELPVIPTFSYEHKFSNGLVADIILPRSIYLRKHISTNGRISLGTELDRTFFYLNNIDATDQKYQYKQLGVNSGLVYEHVIANHFLVTAKTGMKYTPSGKLYIKQDSSDPIYEIKPDPTFYFNIGVSFNPSSFFRKKK